MIDIFSEVALKEVIPGNRNISLPSVQISVNSVKHWEENGRDRWQKARNVLARSPELNSGERASR